jgi:hypothetical protein
VASVSCKQPEAIFLLCMEIQNLQYELMKAGLLVRGSGHVGELIHQQNGVMFGPAFNYAYHLETNVADTPRIILSKQLLDHLTDISNFTADELIEQSTFTVFSDGPYGIDTYQWIESSLDPGVTSYQLETLNALIDAVNQEIDGSRDQPAVYSKLKWHKEMIEGRIRSDKNFHVSKHTIVVSRPRNTLKWSSLHLLDTYHFYSGNRFL